MRFRIQSRAVRIALVAALVALSAAWLGLKLVPLPPALLRPAVQSRELTDRHGVDVARGAGG